MSELTEKIKFNVKESMWQLLIYMIRLLSGGFLGLVIAVANQTLTGTGPLIFMFIVVTTIAVILRITRHWSLMASIILFLSLVLIGVLLKLYIHTATIAG